MQFLSNIRLLLAGLWLGAAFFFVGAAQNAFAVAATREAAGAIVSRNLLVLNIGGIVIGLILLASSFIKSLNTAPFWRWTERFLAVILTAACAVGQFVVALYLEHTKAQIGKPIDEAAADDPLKIQFDLWHQYSVWVLTAAMIAALLLFFLIGRRRVEKVVAVDNNVIDATNKFKF